MSTMGWTTGHRVTYQGVAYVVDEVAPVWTVTRPGRYRPRICGKRRGEPWPSPMLHAIHIRMRPIDVSP
jgi:hypothetical protein